LSMEEGEVFRTALLIKERLFVFCNNKLMVEFDGDHNRIDDFVIKATPYCVVVLENEEGWFAVGQEEGYVQIFRTDNIKQSYLHRTKEQGYIREMKKMLLSEAKDEYCLAT
jgi:hypothetical protein